MCFKLSVLTNGSQCHFHYLFLPIIPRSNVLLQLKFNIKSDSPRYEAKYHLTALGKCQISSATPRYALSSISLLLKDSLPYNVLINNWLPRQIYLQSNLRITSIEASRELLLCGNSGEIISMMSDCQILGIPLFLNINFQYYRGFSGKHHKLFTKTPV